MIYFLIIVAHVNFFVWLLVSSALPVTKKQCVLKEIFIIGSISNEML